MQKIIQKMLELKSCGLSTEPRRLARALTNYANALLRPVDLTLPQMSLLAVIGMEANKTQSAMSEGLALDASTLTRNLIVLEGRGLIESEGGRGRGGKRVTLTPEGYAALERGLGAWRTFNDTLGAEFVPGELEAGLAFVCKLTGIAEKLQPTALVVEQTD